jgi:anthranilate/para-aminobenzoate synthase component I
VRRQGRRFPTPRPGRGAPIRDSLSGVHQKLVERIRHCIRDGDVYQVNLTRSFTADIQVDANDLYAALTAPDPPQCAALLRGDGWSIVSASPEVMLRFDRRAGVATSLPIKGTVRSSGDDAAEVAKLLASAKDEAEHLMIVDVVRNDFGKVAPAGRVSVPDYRAVRTLDYVHHLESTVRAEGLEDVSVADVLAALAPAASITGAPKRAAVHLIRELEPEPRGVYCGAIGWIDADGAELSVAIRTAVVTERSVRYHAGGGIVWDSDPAAEDDECRAKAAPFFQFVGGTPSTSR